MIAAWCVYLGEVVQRLNDVSLDGELEQDELLGQPVLRLATELQHLPAGAEHRGRGHGGLSEVEEGDALSRHIFSKVGL